MPGRFADLAGAARGRGTLPRPNRTLTALAMQLAEAARPLLPEGAGLFMGIEQCAQRGFRLLWWRGRDLRPVAEITMPPGGSWPEDCAESALHDAGAALLDYLAGRWPAPPAALGVITDGAGVAFVPDHPAPSAPGWLDRVAAGVAVPTMIVPFSAVGPCALFIAESAAQRSFH